MNDDPVERAVRARKFWLGHSLDEYDCVLLLPCADDGFAGDILAAFAEMLAGRAAAEPPRAVVLSHRHIEAGARYSVLPVSEETARDILALYCMYEFTDRLIVGSLDQPWGRKARNLLDCRIAPRDELVRALFF